MFGLPPIGDNMGVVHRTLSEKFAEWPDGLTSRLSNLTNIVNQNLTNLHMIRGDLFPTKDKRVDDYEYFLSLIDVADVIEDSVGSADHSIRQGCRVALMADIIIVLLVYYSEFIEEYYEKLAEYLVTNRCTCVSFNWDLLLEHCIQRKYPRIDLSPLYGFTINRFCRNLPEYDYCLLKPHGSINWQLNNLDNDCFSVNLVEPNSDNLVDRLLMNPGYFKPFHLSSSHRFVLSHILSDVAIELASASKLVIIGYSFSSYDLYLEYFLRRRGNNITEVHILDPNACDVQKRVENLFGTTTFFRYKGFSEIEDCLSGL